MGQVISFCCEAPKDKDSKEPKSPCPRVRKKRQAAVEEMKNDEKSVVTQSNTNSNQLHKESQSYNPQQKAKSERDKVKEGKKSNNEQCKKVTIDDFHIKGILGFGGFGVVYLGEFKKNGQDNQKTSYAIKCLYKHILVTKDLIQAIFQQRYLGMKANNFIVPLVMSFQDDFRVFLVMEYAKGGDTYRLINEKNLQLSNSYKCLGQDAIRFIAACVILALEYVHERNYMYRDLKPENVLIFEDGYAKLTDFGLAKKIAKGEVYKGIKGTTFYLAPQIVLKTGYNQKVDLWTLGVFLYQMSNYYPPFSENQITYSCFQKVCQNAQQKRIWMNPKVSSELKDLISKLLKFDPSQRLGYNGWDQIKNHQFFKNFDWIALGKQELQSPLKSLIKKYPVQLTLDKNVCRQCNKKVPNSNVQRRFEDWSYYGKYAQS